MAEMSDFFFNLKKPLSLNRYEDLKYTCNGKVDSYLYKVWERKGTEDNIMSYITPDAQYYVKLTEFGKLDFIKVQKARNSGRMYVKRKFHKKQITEEPVTYYQQFYSGGTLFSYDEQNRIIGYVTKEMYRDKVYYSCEANFYYDNDNNMYSASGCNKQEYDKFGRLLSTTIDDGSEFGYNKRIFEYDEQGRIVKLVECGYLIDMDDSGNGDYIIHSDKGVQMLFVTECSYNSTEAGEVESVCKITDLQHNVTHAELISFDKLGYKRCYNIYTPNGGLDSIYYFDFVYDDLLNWVKLTVSTEFKLSGRRNINYIYEREIQYK